MPSDALGRARHRPSLCNASRVSIWPRPTVCARRSARPGPLIAGLEDSGRAYAGLGTAASDGSPARFGVARQEVRVAEAELGHAVDRIREAGTHDTAASASTSPRATAIEPTRTVVSKVLFHILVLLASAAAGFAASGPIAHATSRLWRPTSRPVP